VLFVRFPGKPIRRFDPATGKELAELSGTDEGVTNVAESSDGKWVVSGRAYAERPSDGKSRPDLVKVLEVRDGATGKLAGKLEVAGAALYLAFAGGESLLVQTAQPRGVFGTETLSRWNVATLKREWEVPGAGYGIALSPDNRRLATAGQQRVFLFNAETGEREVDPNGHSGPVEWVAFSADGETVSTASAGEVITWATTGRRKQRTVVPELRRADSLYLYHSRAHRGNELVWPGGG
jgi:WD40 repeat protein